MTYYNTKQRPASTSKHLSMIISSIITIVRLPHRLTSTKWKHIKFKMKISKMYTELSMKSQTYHQDLPSTIGITKQVHTADTIDASLHHDLSHQHSQGSRSKNTAVVGTTSTTSTAEYSIAVLYNTNDHCDGCIDITEVTGNRLYHHGIARSKKLAERCARESNIKQEQLHPILRKNIDEHYASDLESRAYSTVSKAQSVAAMQCPEGYTVFQSRSRMKERGAGRPLHLQVSKGIRYQTSISVCFQLTKLATRT